MKSFWKLFLLLFEIGLGVRFIEARASYAVDAYNLMGIPFAFHAEFSGKCESPCPISSGWIGTGLLKEFFFLLGCTFGVQKIQAYRRIPK